MATGKMTLSVRWAKTIIS